MAPGILRLQQRWDFEAPPTYAIVSIAADGPPDLRILTPWSVALYNARLQDLSWQAGDR